MSLFSSLVASTDSLRAYDRSLSVSQNNVGNADTPGFAKRRLSFIPKQFDVERGLSGGIRTGPLLSYRDTFSERSVWRQTHTLGQHAQQAADLEQIEAYFPIAEGAGIAGSINKFFNSVSSWSINPNDPVARRVVLDRAASLARSFNETAGAVSATASSVDRQIQNAVQRINTLAARVRDLNAEVRSDRGKIDDPGLDAQLHSTLEELSKVADFNVIYQDDGSVQLLLGGQTPLVIGGRQYEIQADFSFSDPRIVDVEGREITGQLSGGAIYGMLDTRNRLIPAYLNDLNRLASGLSDAVNQTLAGGLDANGSSPLRDLFTYDPTAGAASTLATNNLDLSELAAAEMGSPGGNGNALRLAALAGSNQVDGVTFSEFYGELGARIGRDLNRAKENNGVQEQLLNEAKALRQERSGVSLDEEAARLVEAQRAYQANAQLFQVLNSLTDTLINLLR